MTQRSVTYLKGRFETGDIPTQSDYQDLMDSFVNLEASTQQTMSGALYVPTVIKSIDNLTAAGTSQAAAVLVSADMASVSAEQNQRACVLAAFKSGRQQLITNTGTTVLQVYPASGFNFVGTAANGGINCAVAQSILIGHMVSAYSFVRSN